MAEPALPQEGVGRRRRREPPPPYPSGEAACPRSEVALPCYKRYSAEGFPRGGPLASPTASSPRSSCASTAGSFSFSDGGGGGGSKPSSARTSGISMGYDQRHASPRSSAELEASRPLGPSGAAAASLASPRSSLSSHSSRSSRGSTGAFPEPVPSPRASLLPEDGAADACPRALAGSDPAALLPYGAAPKFRLPCQVTPARESGPSQVERRLEALTLQLQQELETRARREYFGICIKCGKGVYGASQACQAMGNLYHTNCFTCCSCGRRLRGKAFYNVNGKVYCEEDFLILQALGKSYHPGCFRCVVCNECLDGIPFTVDVENNIYCVRDYHT